MTASDIVHVAIAPPVALEANLINKVAALINKDPYETRLLLIGVIPKIVGHYQDMQTAETIAQRLREAGLVAIVCKDSELRKPSQNFRAHTMEFREGEVLFQDQGGHERRMLAGEIFLILKGKRQTQIETETSETKMKLSWGATLLTGGIPIWRRVTQKTSEGAVRTESFARLYEQKPSQSSVELVQHHMNYSFLGAKMTSSSLTNFDTVVTKLRETFPQSAFDDRLAKLPRKDLPLDRAQADLEINCRLLYLYHLATR